MTGRDSGESSFHRTYSWSEVAPSLAIVDAVAAIENTEVENLAEEFETTLFDHVDPNALDTLVTDGDRVTVSFRFADHTVRIDGNDVTVTVE